LLANGKKQTVKTTPMMPLKQIVTVVCEKQGYKDTESYGLKLNKTTLDLGLSVRYANLAPGAKLDFIKVSAPKVHKDVQIALQLDDGGRMIDKFPITTSIWDILLHFEKKSDNGSLNLTKRTAPAPKKKGFLKKLNKSNDIQFYIQPVCLILNQEYGTISSLKSTTLQSAGITSGNAVLRLLFRQTESTLDDVLKDIETPLQTSEVLESVNAPIEITSKNVPAKTLDEQSKAQTDTIPVLDKQPKEPTNTVNVPDEQPKKQIVTVNTPDEQSDMQIDTVNTVDKVDEQPKKQIDTVNTPDEQSDMQIDTVNTVDKIYEQSEMQVDTQNDDSVTKIESISNISSSDIQMEDTNNTTKLDHTVEEEESHDIQLIKNNVPETTQPSISSVTQENIDQEDYVITDKGHFDRDIKVFNPPPENALMSNTTKQTMKHKMAENAGFKTSAIRAKEEKERERKVKFPDSFQLQIAFLSKEHVTDLYEFVKNALRTPDREFELYVSPPKKTLSDKGLTLYQAGLAPASLVYCIWADKSSGSGVGPYLSDEYLKLREDIPNLTINESVSTSFFSDNLSTKINDVVRQQQNDSPKSRGNDLPKSHDSKEHVESSSSNKSKFPKWFKKPK
ncbi:26537_t:CDS:10, partial [Racocetra persica]